MYFLWLALRFCDVGTPGGKNMLDFAIFAVVFVTILIIAVIYLYPGSGKKVSTVPGPQPSDAVEGNLPDVGKAGSLHEYLLELHEEYGDIAGFWWGEQFVVSIASPELFKEHSSVFDRPPMLFKMFEEFIGKDCIQYANGSDGRARRAAYDKSFTHQSCTELMPIFHEVAEELVTKLAKVASEEHIPLGQYMHAMIIKTACLSLFGDYFKNFDQLVAIKNAYDLVWADLELRLTEGVPEPGSNREKRYKKADKLLRDTLSKILKMRRDRPPKDSDPHLFIDTLIDYDCTEEQRISDALAYFVGSIHTSGNHLTWCVYFLASHPEVQEKLYKHLKKELGTSDEVTASAVSDMKYLRQVVDETLRCAVVAPWSARFQDFDTQLGGHIIPKNTPVIHAQGVVLQDEKLWPSPNTFDPDRFSDEKKMKPYQFEAFGFSGKRKCPGYRFAYLEVSVFLAIILRKFKFHLVDDQVATPVYGLVTHPAEEIWVTITKRT